MSDIVKRLRLLAAIDNCQASLEAAFEIERLRAALEVFACDCGPGGEEPCPKPENCRNHIARAALEEGRNA